jgi:uncharacterized protein YqgC (DUF456 family)
VTGVEIAGLLLALLLMGIGVAGSVLPMIPSTPLVVVAAVGHRLYFGESSASNLVLGLMIGLMLLSLVMDHLASMLGARKLGATWRGVAGAVVGGLVGLFFNLPGIILGPFLGAGLFELMGGRPWREATRAGIGAVLGLLLGTVGKIACCVAMILMFTVSVVWRDGPEPITGPATAGMDVAYAPSQYAGLNVACATPRSSVSPHPFMCRPGFMRTSTTPCQRPALRCELSSPLHSV